jgi:hypothetical protein
MLNKNNLTENNLIVCDRGEQFVSVLYNEAPETEKLEFTSHLQTCQACQDEFAAFVEIKNSFADLRENNLTLLESPLIAVPGRKSETLIATNKSNWLDGVRDFFPFSQMWWRGAFASIAFVVCATLLFIFSFAALDQIGSDKTVVKNDKLEQNQSFPTKNVVRESVVVAPTVTNDQTVQENGFSAKNIQSAPVKLPPSVNKRASFRLSARNSLKSSKTKLLPARSPQVEDVLPVEETDNTPRLSDLLDEVGSLE